MNLYEDEKWTKEYFNGNLSSLTWVYGLWNTPSRKALPGGRWRVVPILACAHRYCTYFSRGLMPKILFGSGVASFFISSRQASGAELI